MCIISTDNIDTRSSLEALRDLVTASNLYLRDCKQPNAVLLRDIATYITNILTVFGTITAETSIGFPVSSQSTSGNVSLIFSSEIFSDKFNFC